MTDFRKEQKVESCPICKEPANVWIIILEKIKEKGIIYFFQRSWYIISCNVIGLLLYPLFRLLNIKFLPVYTRAIGHLCTEPDFYLKEAIVGLRSEYKAFILAPRNTTVNQCLLNYWKRYLTFIESPLLCSFLRPLSNNRFTIYNISNYFLCAPYRAPEIQKKYGDQPPLLSLTDFDRQRGWAWLKDLGVPRDAWFVCVHGRENGYLGNVSQSARDVHINNYWLAIEEIIKLGGWVIRMGDVSMQAISAHNRVIDYAHLSIKSDWMDVFLCASCRFFLGSSSGLAALPATFGVPSGIANLIPLSVVLPLGSQDVGIPKLLWSSKVKRYLTFKEILDSPLSQCCCDYSYDKEQIQAIENSPEDILDLAIEMLEKTEGKLVYSIDDERLQKRFGLLMNPSHWSFGAISRMGRDFLRKYSFLLEDK
jgi:putative glycosyltransferase (TIGR04372 family)